MKDEVFKKPIKKQFEFDESVASVFDDMISRSVPYYNVAADLICEILASELKKEARVFDLGCSTASLLLNLAKLRADLELNGIDNSSAMIELAINKSKAFGANLNLEVGDILEFDFANSNAIILNYTLQFIRPIKRSEFVKKIYQSLEENGIFIFSEKLL